MKKLNPLNKLIFGLNGLAAILLLSSYALPFVAPQNFAALSVLSLAVPLFIILNILFLIYWLLKLKKQLFLSLVVLLIGYKYVGSIYKFSGVKSQSDDSDLSVMNYNVRLFNVYDWLEEEDVDLKIFDFISEEQPDVVCFQEFHPTEHDLNQVYPYKHENLAGSRMRHGQVIWSKLPIAGSGVIDFPNSANNAIFTDVIRQQDTFRIYNIHLQSSGINTEVDEISSTQSGRLFKRAASTFKAQQKQAEMVVEHMRTSPYKMVVCGDFNNTVYSYVYKLIKGELIDSFEEAGKGFGRTYDFKYFPMRIDFILADLDFEVQEFKTYDLDLSDHYPILSRFRLGASD